MARFRGGKTVTHKLLRVDAKEIRQAVHLRQLGLRNKLTDGGRKKLKALTARLNRRHRPDLDRHPDAVFGPISKPGRIGNAEWVLHKNSMNSFRAMFSKLGRAADKLKSKLAI